MSTIQLLQAYNGNSPGLYDFGATENARLVSIGLARVPVTTGAEQASPQALTAAQVAALVAIADAYAQQPAVWYAGEVNSVVTPSITADGDLTSATDQLPLKWLAVINADDDVAAAQALMDGGPNVIEILPGAQAQKPAYADDGVTPEVIERIYAVCISSSAVPADYTGGAFILSDLEVDIADALANMARLDFSSGLGATVARLIATPVYNTHYTQLSVAAGVVA